MEKFHIILGCVCLKRHQKLDKKEIFFGAGNLKLEPANSIKETLHSDRKNNFALFIFQTDTRAKKLF